MIEWPLLGIATNSVFVFVVIIVLVIVFVVVVVVLDAFAEPANNSLGFFQLAT